MGIYLKVTPEVLEKMAGDIDKQINDIKTQFDTIDTEINRTKAFWEGEASDTHKRNYDAMKESIAESIKGLRNHPRNLLKMAGVYSDTEAKLTEVAQTLSDDVIV